MALRPSGLLLILAATALAGCSGGSGDSAGAGDYPDAYMLGSYGVPEGFELMDEDSDYWGLAEEEYGMESNPGYADPESFEDEESDEDSDVPVPERLYVAVYVRESEGSEGDEFAFPEIIISMAAEMADEDDIDQALDDEDLCEDADDTGEAGFFMLRDGRFLAVVVALAEDVADDIEDAATEMQEATGAERLCDPEDS